jgi:hypothetical protein
MNDSHLRKRHSPDHAQTTGFIDKLIKTMISDVKKIYNCEKHEIKFKNERPERSKAYEPTEVFNYRILMTLNFSDGQMCFFYIPARTHSKYFKSWNFVSFIFCSSPLILFYRFLGFCQVFMEA